MNKPLNDAIKKIRLAILSAHREGYGKEDAMSPGEIQTMDEFIKEPVDEIVNLWIKVTVGEALGITEWMKVSSEE